MDKSYEIKLLKSLSVGSSSYTTDILNHAINAAGTWSIATSRQGVFAVFNMDTQECSELDDSDCGDVWGVALSKKAQFAIIIAAPSRYSMSTDDKWFLGLWNICKGELLSRFKIDPGSYQTASSPDLKITMTAHRGKISWWNSEEQLRLGSVASPHSLDVFRMAVSNNGSFGATSCTQEAYLWDIEGKKSIKNILLPKTKLFGKRNLIGSLRFGTDHLYMGSNDGKVWVTDLSSTMLEIIIDTGHKNWVEAFDIHEESSLAALLIWGGRLELWDIYSGKLVGAIDTEHNDRVYDVRIKPDVSSVLTAGKDGTVREWSLRET